jgi:hypothetical protein
VRSVAVDQSSFVVVSISYGDFVQTAVAAQVMVVVALRFGLSGVWFS